MAPPAPAGALVATVGDLTNAIIQLTEKIEEQKRWTQAELDALRQKHTDHVEETHETSRSLQTLTDGHASEIAELKKSRVASADFKQQITNIEMKAETANGALEQLIKKCREDCAREMNSSVQQITTKVEAAEASITEARQAADTITSEMLPELRKQLEEERTKRRDNIRRLEKDDAAIKEQFEQRCEEIVALLRKEYAEAIAKLLADGATKEQIENMLRELASIRTTITTGFANADDSIDGLKEELKAHRANSAASFDKHTQQISILTKESGENKSDLQQLTQNTTVDFKKIRESLKEQIAQLHANLAEARAAAAQAAVNNEKNIQVVAAEVTPLKEAKSILFDRLKIKDVATLVRDWQAGHVPTTTASLTDLEARVNRLKSDLQAEHDHGVELQKNVSQVRGHFKKFEMFAQLEPGPETSTGYTEPSTKLPSIPGVTAH